MATTNGAIHLRTYQQEMFERSLQGNVIMDTGSGKTHVALLRIERELPHCREGQLVWFLAPGVELCVQQSQKIATFVPAAKIRVLTSLENVHLWGDRRVWDAALDKVQVVVSTPAVLADALSHSYVTMSRLQLLVFDEAHHCVERHPYNAIMQKSYHEKKRENADAPLPQILGLSASLVMRSNVNSLYTLEQNLDAVSVTPRIHRQELLRHVHRPPCTELEYSVGTTLPHGQVLAALMENQTFRHSTSPSTLQGSPPTVASPNAGSAASAGGSQKTPIDDLCQKAEYIHTTLGQWASEYYSANAIALLQRQGQEHTNFHRLAAPALQLQRILRNVSQRPVFSSMHDTANPLREPLVSHKVQTLLSYLAAQDLQSLHGIIFVQRRAAVNVLCKLLSIHPQTAGRLRCAPFVGLSSFGSRHHEDMTMANLNAQREALAEFHRGGIHLMIATDTLEEGIDVQACNLVFCFDPPTNLKAYVQRRGRARRLDSKWVIVTTADDTSSNIEKWQALEAELERICRQEHREAEASVAAETAEEMVLGHLSSRTTEAFITPDSAMQHLNHFCQRLPKQPYVNLHPEFSYQLGDTGRITATVTLPNCVNENARQASSKTSWTTEKAAAKDAAFQAYKGLYKAGLLNENLLPLTEDWNEAEDAEHLEMKLDQSQHQIDIWKEMAARFNERKLEQAVIRLTSTDDADLTMCILTPCRLPEMPVLRLHWAPSETFNVAIKASGTHVSIDSYESQSLQESTIALHRAGHPDEKPASPRNLIAFLAIADTEGNPSPWPDAYSGRVSARSVFEQGQAPTELLRVLRPYRPVYHFVRWISTAPRDPGAEVECTPLRKRRRYDIPFEAAMREPREEGEHHDSAMRMERYPVDECEVDRLPLSYARFGLFMPSIFEHITVYYTASLLNETLLKPLGSRDLQHIVTAITAPSANRLVNYQRYEFIGDTILKYTVSLYLFAAHPSWHEGFLTKRKSFLVSNEILAKAASAKGLARYIITEPPHNRSWTPPSLALLDGHKSEPRVLRLKLLADVVEALIGAAFLSAGPDCTVNQALDQAKTCINIFLPQVPVLCPALPLPPKDIGSSQRTIDAEMIIGHTFSNKTLLLEALTHGSCSSASTITESYQRLEFLGDAVLDFCVVRRLIRHEGLEQGSMTKIRAAMVNADLLGYFCLCSHVTRVERAVVSFGGALYGPGQEDRTIRLWELLSYNSHASQLQATRAATVERFHQQSPDIKRAMSSGARYPWWELLKLGPEKVFSDMIESVLGAIFVDTDGDLDTCEQFLSHIGLMQYLDCILANGTDVEHPRATVQRLAQSSRVEYQTERYGETYVCRVEVDGKIAVVVGGCRSEDEAVVAAANRALETMTQGEQHL